MIKNETLGARLRRLRLNAGLTQERLAKKAGLSVHNLRNWEHDHREPRLDAVLKLAQALGLSVEELVAGAVKRKSHVPSGQQRKLKEDER